MKVQLYVYDLSQGLARQMSAALIGRQIDAIWHTSVVVFDREYYFGQGISIDLPGQTPHGRPLEIVDMGTTELPKEVFLEYIDNMRQVYTADKYHLLDNNCNTFTNEVCQFLVGKTIPAHITGLPADFASTPLGQTLRPLIDGMFSSRSHHTVPPVAANAPSLASPAHSMIRSVLSSAELDKLLSTSKAVVLKFTSPTCGPCVTIAPVFEQLVRDLGTVPVGAWDARKPGLVAISVDTSVSPAISSKYAVSAVPTFISFADGEQVEVVRGADAKGVETMIRSIMFQMYPRHGHLSKNISVALDDTIEFTAINKSVVFEKCRSFLSDSGDVATLNSVEAFLDGKGSLPAMSLVFFEKLPAEKLFAFIDVLRVLVLKPEFRQLLISSKGIFLFKLLKQYGTAKLADSRSIPHALVIMTLRTTANALAKPQLAKLLLDETPSVSENETTKICPSHLLTNTILSHLLDSSAEFSNKYSSDDKVQQAIASVIFNMSVIVAKVRNCKRGLLTPSSHIPNIWDDEMAEPEYVVDFVSAIIHLISSDQYNLSQETVLRFLCALLLLLYLSPGETLTEICNVLELGPAVKKLAKTDAKFKQWCDLILKLIE